MTVTLYSKTTCAPCRTVKHWLASKGVSYSEKSLDDPVIASEAQALSGYIIAPVIVVDNQVIAGANLSRLAQLIA